MNDFTKEELQTLLDWCVSRAKDINTVDFHREGSGRLFGKIKFMIDNYCEHGNSKRTDGFVRDPTDYTECNHKWDKLEVKHPATPTIICIKCRAIHFIRDNNDNQ